ncbi:hypothetical protein FOMPIDRAFT_110760 [Fomitopsis schrenkii]|uniref:Uncharacterized protein n=1 Tax=Fomitopsis schrenkii TaxID=2126942 RepID=S8EK45_FOMSC|nr:hypothetical protein FOMPIDRAFT_110760 [Fomitopsis schrenkii]
MSRVHEYIPLDAHPIFDSHSAACCAMRRLTLLFASSCALTHRRTSSVCKAYTAMTVNSDIVLAGPVQVGAEHHPGPSEYSPPDRKLVTKEFRVHMPTIVSSSEARWTAFSAS